LQPAGISGGNGYLYLESQNSYILKYISLRIRLQVSHRPFRHSCRKHRLSDLTRIPAGNAPVSDQNALNRSAAPPRRMMMELDIVSLSRLQFAVTAMYHFLFVPLTLGLSILLAIMETV
jgi:hypothetical protein